MSETVPAQSRPKAVFVRDNDTGCHFAAEGFYRAFPADPDEATLVKVTGAGGKVHYLLKHRVTIEDGPAVPEGVDPALFAKALVLAHEAFGNSRLEATAAKLFICRWLIKLEDVRLPEAKVAAEAAIATREKYDGQPLWQRHFETAPAAEILRLLGATPEAALNSPL